jgi:translation initiation factor 2 beta subunit (eIF-2beta)/eIF-5
MEFDKMLDAVYDQLGSKKKDNLVLPPPNVEKNTTRIHWKNIKDFLKVSRSPPDHLFTFIETNLKQKISWFSESISDGLLIFNNKIKAKDISNIMIKYTEEFIICRTCTKSDTQMFKDNEIRKMRIKCNDCKSTYTV